MVVPPRPEAGGLSVGDFFPDIIAADYAKADPHPYLFAVGQTVRLKLGRSDDGQTPANWDGATAVVEGRHTTGIHKEHWYYLRHAGTGAKAEFGEWEIDQRYARKTT